MAAAQLAGEDFLVGLDRVRADQAGQLLVPVPGLATSTAAGIARRFTDKHWRGAEAGLAAATARMVSLLPAERAAELAEGPVTIDVDATDVEVYGSKKRGVAYNYQGQRAGLPHVASWAETEIPLAADLLSGDQDPRSHVVSLLNRALAALPQAVRDGAAAAGRKIALRADAGYFAGELARAAAKEDMAFAIGAKRIPSMWKALGSISDDAWRDAVGMDGAQVAVSPYRPADWPRDTVLLIRRVKLDPDQVSADPRSRRRRTLHPEQRALPFPELEQEPVIYAYSFICTNLDCSTPAKAAAVEHWYRHRTSVENIFRDSRHGAALRHLPSGRSVRSPARRYDRSGQRRPGRTRCRAGRAAGRGLARTRRSRRDDNAELDGRDLICDRLLDEAGWSRQCADWLTHLHTSGFPPAVNLHPEGDHPDRAHVIVDLPRGGRDRAADRRRGR